MPVLNDRTLIPTMQSDNHALGVFNHNKEDKRVNNEIPK